jgi:hypothetical protein
MSKLVNTPGSGPKQDGPAGEEQERREVLKRLGRFASVTAPTVAVILAAESKPGRAVGMSGLTGLTGPTGA